MTNPYCTLSKQFAWDLHLAFTAPSRRTANCPRLLDGLGLGCCKAGNVTAVTVMQVQARCHASLPFCPTYAGQRVSSLENELPFSAVPLLFVGFVSCRALWFHCCRGCRKQQWQPTIIGWYPNLSLFQGRCRASCIVPGSGAGWNSRRRRKRQVHLAFFHSHFVVCFLLTHTFTTPASSASGLNKVNCLKRHTPATPLFLLRPVFCSIS